MTASTWRQASRDDLLTLLSAWTERGWLRELDRVFAAFIDRQSGGVSPLLCLAAALASHQLGRGHVCLDLQAALVDPAGILSLPPEREAQRDADRRGVEPGPPPMTPDAWLAGLDLATWLKALDQPQLVGSGEGNSPLVLINRRLYLRRFWRYENDVRADLARRLADPVRGAADLSMALLRHRLDVLFAPPAGATPPPIDWQKIACALAARRPFAIITGGPGTGKTTTVLRLLALLQSLAIGEGAGPPLRIRLAAPTGKAAARLNQTIAGAVRQLSLAGLPCADPVRQAIPTTVTTLHRLLGSRPDTRRLRHNLDNRLALDVLVVDEASMIDLEMMASLLAALPPKARLILLGDKDQLASVEAGAVLGELCRDASAGHYRDETVAWLAEVTGLSLSALAPALVDPHGCALAQVVAMLRHSHRFSADSGIGQLADRVNAGDVAGAGQAFATRFPDLLCLSYSEEAAVHDLVVEGAVERFAPPGTPPASKASAGQPRSERPVGYRAYLQVVRDERPDPNALSASFDRWAAEVLTAYGRFQVLCVLRAGARGVRGMNRRIESLLAQAGLIDPAAAWYLGRPVMVTRNDYGLGLMNGDVGVTLCVPDAVQAWTLRVAFIDGADSSRIRWVLPSRLQAIETVYAMTVHKAQGSEFSHAALVLPERASPILTRELLYTGITRARSWFSLLGDGAPGEVFDSAVVRRVHRASGLLDPPAGSPAPA